MLESAGRFILQEAYVPSCHALEGYIQEERENPRTHSLRVAYMYSLIHTVVLLILVFNAQLRTVSVSLSISFIPAVCNLEPNFYIYI